MGNSFNAFKISEGSLLIVDPESEYLPIGKELDAEILDISTGTKPLEYFRNGRQAVIG